MQYVQQLLDVVEVKAGGRLVQYVQGFAGIALGQLLSFPRSGVGMQHGMLQRPAPL
jgi:hypothetical protein